MKKIIILVFVVVGLIPSMIKAQTTLATPASCPKTVSLIVTNLGGGQYKVFYQWTNPTSGAKSIQIIINSTPVVSACIDATNDGTAEYTVTSSAFPSVILNMHTGNSTCLGTVCASTFPLILKSLTAQKENQAVRLEWSVVKEMIEEGESFDVERSLDSKNFASIATIPASSEQSNYSYTDNPGSSRVFYRLVLNNNTGKKYSSTIQVGTDIGGPKIEVPQNGNTIRLSRLSGSEVVVFNTAGQPLKTFRVIGDPASINIEGLNPGVYFVRCITKDGITISQAFIK